MVYILLCCVLKVRERAGALIFVNFVFTMQGIVSGSHK